MNELKEKYQEFRDSCLIYGSSDEIRNQHREKLISFLKVFAASFYSRVRGINMTRQFDAVSDEIIKEME